MSVVAWDGSVLAADCQATQSNMRRKTSKIQRLETGEVLAWVGVQEDGMMLAEWYVKGADPEKWPNVQAEDDFTILIVAKPGGVIFYESRPVAQTLLDKTMAWGSGRDYALGAMAMGSSAYRAVEIASFYDIGCGMGIEFHRFGSDGIES